MKKISTFTIGLLTGVAITVSGVAGAATYLKATPKTVKIVVGSNQNSVEAMNVNNKLYVPVRDAGSSFGYSVSGVTSSTITFAEGANVNVNSVGASNTSTTKAGGEYVQGLHDKYSTDGKLDAVKVKAGIAAGEISINAQNKEDGNSLLHYVVLENNFAVYEVIKLNALNPNLVNSELQTPLHLAVINENSFYLGELKNYKADASLKDSNGKRAIDYAKYNSSTYISLEAYML